MPEMELRGPYCCIASGFELIFRCDMNSWSRALRTGLHDGLPSGVSRPTALGAAACRKLLFPIRTIQPTQGLGREARYRPHRHGIEVLLDVWELRLGQDTTKFMQAAISQSDRVLMICTESMLQEQ